MTTQTEIVPREGADIEILDPTAPIPLTALEAQTRGEIDIQITTAKKYPRSIRQFKQEATDLATLDEEVASSCFYSLPRSGKTISGPSVRLAEIVASAWGHLRVETRIVEEDDKFITARGVAWDLQKNVAFASEVRRRITDKHGRKFNDDMIAVTANAACSIASRNAVFKVVPNALTKVIYEEARRAAIGDVKTLAAKRQAMLAHFGKMGVQPETIFASLGVKGEEDIGSEELLHLKGVATAIKDGETSIEGAFAIETTAKEPPKEGRTAFGFKGKAASGDTPKPADVLPTVGKVIHGIIEGKTGVTDSEVRSGIIQRWADAKDIPLDDLALASDGSEKPTAIIEMAKALKSWELYIQRD